MEINYRIQRLCTKLHFYYTVILGMNSYHYDYVSKTYKQTSRLRIAALLANIITILILPIVEWYNLKQILIISAMYFDLSLLGYCNLVYVAMRTLTILYTVLHRHVREKSTSVIVTQLIKLNSDCLSEVRLTPSAACYFNRLFYCKYIGFLVLSLLEFVPQLHFLYADDSWYSYVHMIIASNISIILHITTFNYFLNMWHVCRALCQVNQKLSDLIRRMASRELAADSTTPACHASLHDDLRQVVIAHWQCVCMVQRLNHIYRFQMIASRFTCLMTNVLMGYWMCTVGFNMTTPTYIKMYGSLAYIAGTIDVFLIDLICDKTLRSYNLTVELLRNFNTIQMGCKRFNVLCESFALRLNSYEFRLSQCGLFAVDKRMWLQMFSAVLSYSIVLVQSDVYKH